MKNNITEVINEQNELSCMSSTFEHEEDVREQVIILRAENKNLKQKISELN